MVWVVFCLKRIHSVALWRLVVAAARVSAGMAWCALAVDLVLFLLARALAARL